jgi:hypothetical protein
MPRQHKFDSIMSVLIQAQGFQTREGAVRHHPNAKTTRVWFHHVCVDSGPGLSNKRRSRAALHALMRRQHMFDSIMSVLIEAFLLHVPEFGHTRLSQIWTFFHDLISEIFKNIKFNWLCDIPKPEIDNLKNFRCQFRVFGSRFEHGLRYKVWMECNVLWLGMDHHDSERKFYPAPPHTPFSAKILYQHAAPRLPAS